MSIPAIFMCWMNGAWAISWRIVFRTWRTARDAENLLLPLKRFRRSVWNAGGLPSAGMAAGGTGKEEKDILPGKIIFARLTGIFWNMHIPAFWKFTG